MRIMNDKILVKFLKKHRNAKIGIEIWKSFIKNANWRDYQDVKADYPKVRLINEYRVVFKIDGNKWRIDRRIDYQGNRVIINRVGTHEEYNKWKY